MGGARDRRPANLQMSSSFLSVRAMSSNPLSKASRRRASTSNEMMDVGAHQRDRRAAQVEKVIQGPRF
jgi:hypothetical protein